MITITYKEESPGMHRFIRAIALVCDVSVKQAERVFHRVSGSGDWENVSAFSCLSWNGNTGEYVLFFSMKDSDHEKHHESLGQ